MRPCECDDEIVPGVLYPMNEIEIQRCDQCRRFGTDEAAAERLARELDLSWTYDEEDQRYLLCGPDGKPLIWPAEISLVLQSLVDHSTPTPDHD